MERIVAQNAESATERKENFRRGDFVLAKTAGGEWVRRRVWNDEEDVVYLCSDRLYDDLSRNASVLWPIGFPKSDVRRAHQ